MPKGWREHVKSAVLQVISLAQYSAAYTRGWAANSLNERVRLRAQNDRLETENALLREEIRIKDARMGRLPAPRRPHYPPTERMAILEMKAARGWSLKQTAKTSLLAPATIASWGRRVDRQGPDTLVQLRTPVNRFPEFVRYAVGRLKAVCPSMGKVKIADTLCRAGLHLGATTVGRMLKENPHPKPTDGGTGEPADRIVKADRPDHVWHVDLTTVPISRGFWTTWPPLALTQCWPFCWWLVVVVDHYSRRCMGVMIFRKQPMGRAVREFLDRTINKNRVRPKYIISDKGGQFWSDDYKAWCKEKNIRPRFGAVGQHGSIAVIERFIKTLKTESASATRVPYRRRDFREALACYVQWYNTLRPHAFLHGATPAEAYHRRHPKCRHPRWEPRPDWPRGSPCASPRVPVKGKPGVRLELDVTFHGGYKHLPVVRLKRVA